MNRMCNGITKMEEGDSRLDLLAPLQFYPSTVCKTRLPLEEAGGHFIHPEVAIACGIVRTCLIFLALCFVSACGMSKTPAPEPSPPKVNFTADGKALPDTPVLTLERVQKLAAEPLSPKETGEVVDTALTNFFYGPGLGETALDVTGVMLFPPYAMVLIGQTLVRLAGYESPRFIEMFPQEQQQAYDKTMDTVYSGPGRLVSAAAGEEYRTRSRVRSRWVETVEKLEANRSEGGSGVVVAQSSASTGVRPLPERSSPLRQVEPQRYVFFPSRHVTNKVAAAGRSSVKEAL
jgi:hypothetical protein